MKKKIFIITGMILCILAGIVIVPSVIRTRQAVKEFEKDFHVSANSGADSAGIDSEDEPAAENEEVSEEEEKKAFELDTYLDHRDMTHRLYIYDMDYIEKAISFEKKSLQDFEEVIQQNPKILRAGAVAEQNRSAPGDQFASAPQPEMYLLDAVAVWRKLLLKRKRQTAQYLLHTLTSYHKPMRTGK